MFDVNNTRAAEVFAVREHDALHLNKNAARADADGDAPAGGGLTLKQAEEALRRCAGNGRPVVSIAALAGF